MVIDVVEGALLTIAIYVAIGSILAVPFVIFGIGRVDRSAKGAPAMFRVLVLPGVVALWPLILRRWLSPRRES
jgi:hypothetical protein